ncbi:MAG TPA: DUF2330 domain-containing protein [bacterium]|nr:DUF2330 domain-containing protein [bacterium]
MAEARNAAAASAWSGSAHAFCGFYVAKADTKLFNKASQVAIVHDGDRTVMTMSNDFQGDLKDFAIVIPVPVQLEKEQIHVGERALLAHLDAYSSPRLVEYTDADPCAPPVLYEPGGCPNCGMSAVEEDAAPAPRQSAKSLGVTIEAEYTVGEYDILMLSAKQSDGLETWLRQEGYKPPKGAAEVLGSYIQQKMHFFVAKVNLKEQSKTGYTYLRPIQVAYESPKFMLPIRLGTVNADGPQELFVYAITKTGRVETTNYKTVPLPTGQNVPEYTKDEFGKFYKAMFTRQTREHSMNAVFTEYTWDMSSCDPCAAEPLGQQELKGLGVWWAGDPNGYAPVFLTRLHVRYDAAHFPEDLVFQQTPDAESFQGRYVMQHPFPGWESESCSAIDGYRTQLHARHEEEAKNLSDLTGWSLGDVRKRMKLDDEGTKKSGEKSWYKNLWK